MLATKSFLGVLRVQQGNPHCGLARSFIDCQENSLIELKLSEKISRFFRKGWAL